MRNNQQKTKSDEKIYSKNQLRFYIAIVIIIVMALFVIWVLTTHNESNFFSHFSFASTVTSIILSVLAIFMSVTEASRTQTIREKIEQEAEIITKTTSELKEKNNGAIRADEDCR